MCEDFGEWGYEMSSIRIVVKIPTGTYPELVADLNQVAPRERAERLRLLAMIGLRDLREVSLAQVLQPVLGTTFPLDDYVPEQKKSATNFIRNLTKGL
jgi:hypothetical protein